MNNITDIPQIKTVALATADEMRERIRRQSKRKGRQPDAVSVAEVRALVGEAPHRRDLLIEHLHTLNDAWRGLHNRHLVALASEMNIPMAEVYEVATFYHHFEVLEDGAQGPGLTVRVCDGLSCQLAGADDLLARLPALLGAGEVPGGIRVVAAPCIGRCEQAPAVAVGQRVVACATLESVVSASKWPEALVKPDDSAINFDPSSLAEQGVSPSPNPAAVGYDAYRAHGGYTLAAAVVNGEEAAEADRQGNGRFWFARPGRCGFSGRAQVAHRA